MLLADSLCHGLTFGRWTLARPLTTFGQARCVVLVWRISLDLGRRFAIIVCRIVTQVFLPTRRFALGALRYHGLILKNRISLDHENRFAIIIYSDPMCVVFQNKSIVKRFSRVVLVFLLDLRPSRRKVLIVEA
jgi:hypothetical protein